MGVVCVFADGPLNAHKSVRHFTVPEPPHFAWYAPQPQPPDRQDGQRTADGWMSVGYTQPPEWPWPGQIRYDLHEWPAKAIALREALGPGVVELPFRLGEDSIAVFKLRSELYQYTIYDHPTDYPDGFVVRAHAILGPGKDDPAGVPVRPVVLGGLGAPDLEHARQHVPEGLFRIDRSPDDHPNVVEVWT